MGGALREKELSPPWSPRLRKAQLRVRSVLPLGLDKQAPVGFPVGSGVRGAEPVTLQTTLQVLGTRALPP